MQALKPFVRLLLFVGLFGLGSSLNAQTTIIYTGLGFTELTTNVGSVSGSITVILSGDTFQDVDADNILDIGSEVVINGIPAGFTATLIIGGNGGAGAAWSAQSTISSSWTSITYGNGLFVALAESGSNRVMTSPDGTTWTPRSAAENNRWNSVAFGNNLFVAVSETGTNRIMTSPDGISWTAVAAPVVGEWQAITHDGSKFLAVGRDNENFENYQMTSSDGINWSTQTFVGHEGGNYLAHGNSTFVMTNRSKLYKVSDSGVGFWDFVNPPERNTWNGVAFGNGIFVTVASSGTNRVMTSPDGENWTLRTAAENNSWKTVAFGDGLFVALANSGTNRIMTSPDGITWTAVSAPEANNWSAVAFADNRFVAVSSSGTNRAMTSAKGGMATLSLTGVANNHLNANDVSDITFSFDDTAFSSTAASGVTGATGPASSGLGVDFTDNTAPLVTAPSAPVVTEDDLNVALADDIAVVDADLDAQTLSFTITGGVLNLGTTGVSFGGGGNGSDSFTAAGSFADLNVALDAATFTPTPDLNGTAIASISFSTNDGLLSSASASVSFDITAVNDDPIFTSTGITAIETTSLYDYQVGFVDVDGDELTFTPTTIPSWLSITSFELNVVTTLAGSTTSGTADGTGTDAQLNVPLGIDVDATGNIYVADRLSSRVRKITPEGVVTTYAGGASFQSPYGVAVDLNGNVYVVEQSKARIRKITPGLVVSTLAGGGTGVNTTFGHADGTGTEALFSGPTGITTDAAGNVYVADFDHGYIRKITPGGVVTTLAGNGTDGYTDGTATDAQFDGPLGVAVDPAGNVYVGDSGNDVIRKITPAGVVSTLAGSGTRGYADGTGTVASFSNPFELELDSDNNIYVADDGNRRIRKVTPNGVVTTVAGSINGTADGTGEGAQFLRPQGLALDASGNLYISEITGGSRIRKMRIPAGIALSGNPSGQIGAHNVSLKVEDGNGGQATQVFNINVGLSSVTVAAKVFLEGAYNGSDLDVSLNGKIPLSQPYTNNGHAGAETAASIPANAVDWVLVELRDAASAATALSATKVGSTAGFLMNDGTIKATDGTSDLTVSLTGNTGEDYYVVIYHRNHLSIMSANAISVSGGKYTIDFTSASTNTHQTTTALTSLAGGKFGMPSGDADGDGDVDAADLNPWRSQNGGVFTYNTTNGDFNLDGVVNAIDRNAFWKQNSASNKSTQVPNL